MPVSPLALEDAGILAPLYNRLVADVPFCYPVSEDDYAAGVVLRGPDQNAHAPRQEQQLLVNRRDDEILAFADTVLERRDDADRGIIRFFGYTPGERTAGQELLESAEARLRDAGAREVVAFSHDYGYPFYHFAFGYLSDRLAHILGLLGVNGYTVAPEGPDYRAQEIFFDWPDYDVPRPDSPDEKFSVHVLPRAGHGRLPNARIYLRHEGERVGLCDTGCVGDWIRAEEAQETFFVRWLGIDEKWQNRGCGRYLLLSSLYELRGLGYRRSTISTNLTNYRAMTFYASIGYKVVDTAYALTKPLE